MTESKGQARSGEQFFDVEETRAIGWERSTVRYTWTQLLDTFEEGCLTRTIMDSHAQLAAQNAALVAQAEEMGKALERFTSHRDCDDCWYSCATICCNERRKSDECDCGAQIAMDALAAYRERTK